MVLCTDMLAIAASGVVCHVSVVALSSYLHGHASLHKPFCKVVLLSVLFAASAYICAFASLHGCVCAFPGVSVTVRLSVS